MTLSPGTRARRPGPAGIAAAARYRELRINSGLYGLALALLFAPWMPVFTLRKADLPYGLVGLAGHNSLGNFGVIVAGALGIALFARDQWQGGLVYALEGPLRRRDVWLAKGLYGVGTILTANAVVAASMLALGRSAGGVLLTAVLLRVLVVTCAEVSLLLTSLALCSAMSPTMAGVATAFWLMLPGLLSAFLGIVTGVTRPGPVPVRTAQRATELIGALPPLSPVGSAVSGGTGYALGPVSGGAGHPIVLGGHTIQVGIPVSPILGHAVWFLAWGLAMAILALQWWERAPLERLHRRFFFPALANFYYALLSLFTAIVVMWFVSRVGGLGGGGYAAGLAVVFVAGWFVWRRLLSSRDAEAPEVRGPNHS